MLQSINDAPPLKGGWKERLTTQSNGFEPSTVFATPITETIGARKRKIRMIIKWVIAAVLFALAGFWAVNSTMVHSMATKPASEPKAGPDGGSKPDTTAEPTAEVKEKS